MQLTHPSHGQKVTCRYQASGSSSSPLKERTGAAAPVVLPEGPLGDMLLRLTKTLPQQLLNDGSSGGPIPQGESPPPPREQGGSEPAQGPFSPSTASAREQLASALPPRSSNPLRPHETLLRHLGRTDSANHAQEMEALQQVALDFLTYICRLEITQVLRTSIQAD